MGLINDLFGKRKNDSEKKPNKDSKEPVDLLFEAMGNEGVAELIRLRREGKFEEALKINDKIDGNEKPPHYWYNRGSIFRDMSKSDEAVSCFNKAIEKDPNYAKAYYWKGITLFTTGFEKKSALDKVDIFLKANDSFEKVLELARDPKNKDEKSPAKQFCVASHYYSFRCLGYAQNGLSYIGKKSDDVHLKFLLAFQHVYTLFRNPLKRFDNGGIIFNDGPKEFIIYDQGQGPKFMSPDYMNNNPEDFNRLVGDFLDFCNLNADEIGKQIMPNYGVGVRTDDGNYAATIRHNVKV